MENVLVLPKLSNSIDDSAEIERRQRVFDWMYDVIDDAKTEEQVLYFQEIGGYTMNVITIYNYVLSVCQARKGEKPYVLVTKANGDDLVPLDKYIVKKMVRVRENDEADRVCYITVDEENSCERVNFPSYYSDIRPLEYREFDWASSTEYAFLVLKTKKQVRKFLRLIKIISLFTEGMAW